MRQVIERLESRTLLATHVINGGPGGDLWHIEAQAGQLLVNGQTISNPAITDVQVNGFGGEDLLVINHASIPVVFNGGDQNDWLSLTSGLMTAQITSVLTYNDGNGNDLVELRDEVMPGPLSYSLETVLGVPVVRWETGSLLLQNPERLILNTAAGGSTVQVSARLTGNATTINGGGGADNLFVNLQATPQDVRFDGNGGEDLLDIDDTGPSPNMSGEFYALSGGLSTSQWAGYGTGGPFVRFDDATESLNFRGHASLNRNYNVFSSGPTAFNVTGGNGNDNFYFWPSDTHGAIGGPVTVSGGAGNDTFLWPATNNVAASVAIVVQPVLLDGGSGFNSLSIDDTTRANTGYDFYPDRVRARDVLATEWADFRYDNMGAIGITASAGSNAARVYGISDDIAAGQQVTLLLSGGNDNATVFPRDAGGELTINGNFGIGGGAGTDTVTIDASASANPTDYHFYNQFGPGTTNVGTLGTGGFGAGGDVENLTINAGSGNDKFRVNKYLSTTTKLTINAGPGDDEIFFGTSNLTLDIADASRPVFNGQGGFDTWHVNNSANPAGFTYERNPGASAFYDTATAASDFYPNDSGIESMEIHAGGQTDLFYIHGTSPGEGVTCNGGAGLDGLILGQLDSTLENIRGPIVYHAGAGGGNMGVIDSADTTGDVVHLTADSLGAYAGDTLFGPGGSLRFSDLVNVAANPGIGLVLGSGADTIYAQPLATARVTISAGNPTDAPGDTLNLALAAAQNYVITPGSSGNVTANNRHTLDWTGIETGPTVDDVAPSVVGADINLDGIAGPDGSVRRQSLDVRFSENVSGLISASWLQLTNLTVNQTIPGAAIAVEYDGASNTAHFTFPGYPSGVLPDGNYGGAVLAGLPDFFGNGLPANVPFSFFFLQGDANHDGRVNLTDFNILAANLGQSNRTFSQGDFNYDGTVNLADFNLLASRFGTALSPAIDRPSGDQEDARDDELQEIF